MTQQYEASILGCDSDSDCSASYWSEEDEDRFCGDPEWEFSLAAVSWEARQKMYAQILIKEGQEEEALTHIRFLFVEEEEEECVTCNLNWDSMIVTIQLALTLTLITNPISQLFALFFFLFDFHYFININF